VAKKKKRRDKKKKQRRPTMTSQVIAELAEAEELMNRRRWDEAVELLLDLDRRLPDNPAVLSQLAAAYRALPDYHNYLEVCERLHTRMPHVASALLALADAYMVNVYPALALQAFRRFLQQWPNDSDTATVRRSLAEIEPLVEPVLAKIGGPEGERLELAALNDRILLLLGRGQNSEAIRVAQQILDRRPEYLPAVNNISEARAREGLFTEAIDTSRRVLATHPDNYHALANLTKNLLLSGRQEEAQAAAQRLKAVTSSEPDFWAKKAEALSYLGDDEGVLEAWQAAQQARTPS
jgi:tetratricopeptide (TPR) repeat protein